MLKQNLPPRCTAPGLALAALGLITTASMLANDWPHWRGPDLNGVSREKGWTVPASGEAKILWRAKVGIGFSSFSVAGGRVYTMGNRKNAAGKEEDTVFCFDAASGKELWQFSYLAPLDSKYYEGGTSATPTVDGDRVYSLSKRGLLHCLEAASGRELWSRDVPKLVEAKLGTAAKVAEWGFAGSVLVQGDRLFVNVGTYGTALDKTGQLIWTTGADASGYSTLVPFTLGSQKGLAVFAAREVAALDATDGRLLWSHPWKTSYDVNAADPIFSGDLLFISSGYNRGAAALRVGGSTPTPVWESKVMRNQFNSSVLLGDHLYGVDENILKCIELKTGAEKWADKSVGKGSLMAADGKLIVLSEKGTLLVAPADPSAFKPISSVQVLGGKCWTTPILSNGRIYCRNAAGDVVCIDVSG